MLDDLNELRTLRAIVAAGSLSAAGRALGVSLAVVSKHLSTLEGRVGLRLVNRTTRTLSPTEEGLVLLTHLDRALEAIDEAEEQLATGRDEPIGMLRVTAPVSFGRRHVAPVLAALVARHPRLDAVLSLDDRLVDVAGGAFDVAIRIGGLAGTSATMLRLADNHRVLAASPAYLNRRGRPATPDDLADHAFLRYGDGIAAWELSGPDGTPATIAARPRLRAGGGDVIHDWCLAGHGIMLKSIVDMGDDLAGGRLERRRHASRGTLRQPPSPAPQAARVPRRHGGGDATAGIRREERPCLPGGLTRRHALCRQGCQPDQHGGPGDDPMPVDPSRLAWVLGLAVTLSFPMARTADAQSAPRGCATMAAVPVPAGAIGLPTGGARVTGATPVEASGTGLRAVGAFCHVTAEIASLDAAAPPIRLEVNLPDAWNGKALMYGGGGFNGSLLSSPGTIRLQPATLAVPLGRGYATFSSDSGHQGSSTDGSFALNDEALRNYAYDALKKTRDVAGLLIAARYGRPADKVYFHGSSNGGKEALGMLQRNPADLDGAIVFWPAVNFTRLALQHARLARAFLQPGAYPGIGQRDAALRAAVQACDRLDGAGDGVISDARRCQSAFDPATATLDGKALRCQGDGGPDCLTDAQIAALRLMGTPIALPGGGSYPGFDIWGTDLGSRTNDAVSRSITEQGLGTVASAYPTGPGMPFMQNFADQFLKYFVARDAGAALPDFDPEHPGRWQARLDALGSMMDLDDADLSAFARHGGRVLLLHGKADQIIPTRGTEQYYAALVQRMGRDQVATFLRFYELPATAHSGNSLAFMPSWDALGALDAWVTTGTPPQSPVVTDSYGRPGRSRPLCEYPASSTYKGTGSLDDAANFTCAP